MQSVLRKHTISCSTSFTCLPRLFLNVDNTIPRVAAYEPACVLPDTLIRTTHTPTGGNTQ